MAGPKQLAKKKVRTDGSEQPLLRELAYERLKTAIQEGELLPGEPLSETRLSEALQISRTPVREALHQLAQEGLVQNIPNRAMTVAAPSIQEVLNVLHVRSLIEPEMVRLITESATDETIALVAQAVEKMEAAARRGDRAAWSKADHVFHEALTDACPNALLGKLGLQMHDRIHYLAIDSQTTQGRLLECTDEHRAILDAIAARDPQLARKAMEKHMQQLRASIFKLL